MYPQTLASISGHGHQYFSQSRLDLTPAHRVRAFAEMPAERMTV